MSEEKKMETNIRLAASRQIHNAIDHLHKSDFETAITLAHAAEGALPNTDKPHLTQKVKALANSLPDTDENRLNAQANWLKHGTKFKAATISELDVIGEIQRAVSKYAAVYGGVSPQMKEFADWARERLQAQKNSN